MVPTFVPSKVVSTHRTGTHTPNIYQKAFLARISFIVGVAGGFPLSPLSCGGSSAGWLSLVMLRHHVSGFSATQLAWLAARLCSGSLEGQNV